MNLLGIVLDQQSVAKFTDDEAAAFVGGWKMGLDAWRRVEHMKYLLMLAPTAKRMKLNAPLVFMSADLDTLKTSVKLACSELSDVKCSWVLFLENGSPAQKMVGEELLIDSVPAGSA
jgi:hypothetical protein